MHHRHILEILSHTLAILLRCAFTFVNIAFTATQICTKVTRASLTYRCIIIIKKKKIISDYTFSLNAPVVNLTPRNFSFTYKIFEFHLNGGNICSSTLPNANITIELQSIEIHRNSKIYSRISTLTLIRRICVYIFYSVFFTQLI